MEVTPDNVATDPESFQLLEKTPESVVEPAHGSEAVQQEKPSEQAPEQAPEQQERPEDSKYIAQFDNVKAALADAASAVATCDRVPDDENRVRALIATVKALSAALSQQYALSVMQHNYFNDV